MRLIGGWSDDPLWGSFYDWTVEHRRVGGALWALGIQSDLGRLYDAAAEIGRQPGGSRILDIPCGGGIAVRSLRPGQGVDYVAADISQKMLDRTMRRAEEIGVADQVTPEIADVGDLPFHDASYDLVVSFTGLHCFPDPARAVVEMVRVLKPGGIITGSALTTDSGLRFAPMRQAGRAARILGPMCSTRDIAAWLKAQGIVALSVEVSGAMTYFRGRRTLGARGGL